MAIHTVNLSGHEFSMDIVSHIWQCLTTAKNSEVNM